MTEVGHKLLIGESVKTPAKGFGNDVYFWRPPHSPILQECYSQMQRTNVVANHLEKFTTQVSTVLG